MIYCISDIHGELESFEKMLDTISLQDGDKLYILGDVIDRGGGLSVLLRVMELQKQGLAVFIKGNHENSFASFITNFDQNAVPLYENMIQRQELARKNKKQYKTSSKDVMGAILNLITSVENTVNSFQFLDAQNKALNSVFSSVALSSYGQYRCTKDYFAMQPQERFELLQFIRNAPLYIDLEVSGKKYRLMHSGCSSDGVTQLDIRQDFYKNTSPIEDTTIIFGHTTTRDIRAFTENKYAEQRIWYDTEHNNDKIGIDCGAPFPNGKLACLRLDDMVEFYISNQKKPQDFVADLNSFAKEHNVPVDPTYSYRNAIETFANRINNIW